MYWLFAKKCNWLQQGVEAVRYSILDDYIISSQKFTVKNAELENLLLLNCVRFNQIVMLFLVKTLGPYNAFKSTQTSRVFK